MKNCNQFREIFEAYALGALDAAERISLEAHLATGCKDCAKSVEEARWLVSQLAYLAPEAAPSDMLNANRPRRSPSREEVCIHQTRNPRMDVGRRRRSLSLQRFFSAQRRGTPQ
jgi:anti-sigma factor RsiW